MLQLRCEGSSLPFNWVVDNIFATQENVVDYLILCPLKIAGRKRFWNFSRYLINHTHTGYAKPHNYSWWAVWFRFVDRCFHFGIQITTSRITNILRSTIGASSLAVSNIVLKARWETKIRWILRILRTLISSLISLRYRSILANELEENNGPFGG